MAINIFQFDWIFIDTIVIILLIVFLLIVKIFKERYRWRSSLSNTALDQFLFEKQSIEPLNQSVMVKKFRITVNNVLKDTSMRKPSLLLIKTNAKKIFEVLTEGLASYGFNVIDITLNIKSSNRRFSFEKKSQDLSQPFISTILNFLKERQLMNNLSYLTIIHQKSKFSSNSILFDKNNLGMILINPKIDIFTELSINGIIENRELLSKLYLIFSKKSSLFLTSKNLKDFLIWLKDCNVLKSNLQVLDRSKSSFKYYETILLGIIINIIDSNILKSSILS